jgi:hypothetical protein
MWSCYGALFDAMNNNGRGRRKRQLWQETEETQKDNPQQPPATMVEERELTPAFAGPRRGFHHREQSPAARRPEHC